MTDIQKLLSRMDRVQQIPAKKHAQSFSALCPSHSDKNPSLCIDVTHDGRILLYCRAGCGAAEVMAAVGLSLSDLFPDAGKHQPPGFFRPLYAQKDYEEAYTTGKVVKGYIDKGIKPKPSDLPHIRKSIRILRYFEQQIQGGSHA